MPRMIPLHERWMIVGEVTCEDRATCMQIDYDFEKVSWVFQLRLFPFQVAFQLSHSKAYSGTDLVQGFWSNRPCFSGRITYAQLVWDWSICRKIHLKLYCVNNTIGIYWCHLTQKPNMKQASLILFWSNVASGVVKYIGDFWWNSPNFVGPIGFCFTILWRFTIPNLLRLWAKLYRNPSFCWSLKYLVVDRRFHLSHKDWRFFVRVWDMYAFFSCFHLCYLISLACFCLHSFWGLGCVVFCVWWIAVLSFLSAILSFYQQALQIWKGCFSKGVYKKGPECRCW